MFRARACDRPLKYDTYTLEQFDEALGADQVLDASKVVLTMTFADGKEINFHGMFALLMANKELQMLNIGLMTHEAFKKLEAEEANVCPDASERVGDDAFEMVKRIITTLGAVVDPQRLIAIPKC